MLLFFKFIILNDWIKAMILPYWVACFIFLLLLLFAKLNTIVINIFVFFIFLGYFFTIISKEYNN